MKSYCVTCNRQTNQIVLREEKNNILDDMGWWEDNTFQIIKCGGCDEISFRKLYDDAQQHQFADKDEDTTSQELYPKRSAHSRPIKAYKGLPLKIKTIYSETINAYNSDLKVLASIGTRAIVEAICLDKKIVAGIVTDDKGKKRKSKSLDGKISGLSAYGFLTSENAETLHELRFLGNEAAHEVIEPSIKELRLALDIIELVIDNIYTIKRTASYLKEEREGRRKKNDLIYIRNGLLEGT